MSVTDDYSKLPFELSGASSKNRFRLEMLCGASKMFDLFDEDDLRKYHSLCSADHAIYSAILVELCSK